MSELTESRYVIVCINDLTEERVNQSVGGAEALRLIRNDRMAVLEYKIPYPDCCAGYRKYTRDEIEVIVEDDTVFVSCEPDGDGAKDLVMCADDRKMTLTWAEIDGVRRVVQIRYTSPSVNAALNKIVEIVRDFTYQLVDPFDLIEIDDTVLVT